MLKVTFHIYILIVQTDMRTRACAFDELWR